MVDLGPDSSSDEVAGCRLLRNRFRGISLESGGRLCGFLHDGSLDRLPWRRLLHALSSRIANEAEGHEKRKESQ